jgi:hypothetical protein
MSIESGTASLTEEGNDKQLLSAENGVLRRAFRRLLCRVRAEHSGTDSRHGGS